MIKMEIIIKQRSIHKLADIYHSDLIVVGKPEAPAADDGYN